MMVSRTAVRLAVLAHLAGAAASAAAADSGQFWPELDAYVSLDDRTRLFLLASGSVFGGEFQDMQVGAHLDFTLVPAFRSQLRVADWQRHRYLWMRMGYRYGRSLGDTERDDRFREHRALFELTGRTAPLAGGIEWVGRFRWDARDVNDQDSDRYRLRIQGEKSFTWEGRAVVPFLNAEAFYDTRFDRWNRWRYQAGAEFEIDKDWRVEAAFNYQTDSRSQPARVKAIGITLKYFH